MKFKQRIISLLLAVLLAVNSIPVGHASRGEELTIKGDLATAVTDVVYGWNGGVYQFPASVLEGVEEGDKVYLTAKATVEGVTDLPTAGTEILVRFSDFEVGGDDAEHYLAPDFTDLPFEKTIKVLPKTLLIRPSMTETFYGQTLPKDGKVPVSDDYKAHLVREDDDVTISCNFTFDLDGATEVGTYPLNKVGKIRMEGDDSGNYEAVVENEENLVFSIVAYETDAVAYDGDAEGNQNGKDKATLEAPEGFLISKTGSLTDEGWGTSIEIDVEESMEADQTHTAEYYLRNNDDESAAFRAICKKTYTYSAVPIPTVTGIEIAPGVREELNGEEVVQVSTKLTSREEAIYADGNVLVTVYVRGASFAQETQIVLCAGSEEITLTAEEAGLEDGKYTYKAVFELPVADEESVVHQLKAYAKNNAGDGEKYPAEDCQDCYVGSATPVTQPLILDRKDPVVTVNPIETVRYLGIPIRLKGTFTVEDIYSGIAKVEYKWDNQEYREYTGRNTNPYEVAMDWSRGSHTLYVRVTDVAGNVTELDLPKNGKDDFVPPVIDSVLVEGAEDTDNGLLASGAVRIIVKTHDDESDTNSGVSGVKSVHIIGKKLDPTNGQYHNYREEAKWNEQAGGYVLTLSPNTMLTDVAVLSKDEYFETELALNKIPIQQPAPAEGEEPSTEVKNYQSNKLYIENTKPTVSFEEAEKMGFSYDNEDNFWFGLDDKGEMLTIKVKEDGVISGVKKIVVKDTFVADDGSQTVTEVWNKEYSFGTPNVTVEIPVQDFVDGEHWLTVVVTDYSGNKNGNGEGSQFHFTKDLTKPESGDIDPDKTKIRIIESENWFSKPTEKDFLTFRIGTSNQKEKLSKIIIWVNGVKREYSRIDQKYGIEDDQNGGSYINISTADAAFEMKVPSDDESIKSHYEVKAVFVDKAGNASEPKTKIVYVDREAPKITRITVMKKDETLLSQIIRILSFGIFSNDTLIFRVYSKDGAGDIGIAGATMKYSAESEAREMAWDEDAGCHYIEVSENDVTKLGATISFCVTDKLNKEDVEHPLIENENNENDNTRSFLVMVESQLPSMSFDLAGSDAIEQNDYRWYNGMPTNEVDGALFKEVKLEVQDLQSGLYSIVIDVNGEKRVLYQEMDDGSTGPDTDAFEMTFNAYKSLLDQSKDLEDGEYHIAIKVVDNAGNTATHEDVYYIDTVKPKIDKLSFSATAAGDVTETAEIIEGPQSVEYGYFFKENFDIIVHVSDAVPSSGLYRVRYWLKSMTAEMKEVEVVDGKAFIDVPDNFKGQIFYEVLDWAGNSSGIQTTKAFVVDQTAPTIEIIKNKTTEYRDAKGNPLYIEASKPGDVANSITVTITDTVSGLNQLGYTKAAELDPQALKQTGISQSGSYSVGTELAYEWEIVSMDMNLVTQVTKTFTFDVDDNDVQMTFFAKDQSLLQHSDVKSEIFTVDKTRPNIVVDFGSDNDDDLYYNQNRVAQITVTERNFDETLINVLIENMFGSVPGYKFSSVSSTMHTATINFDEGDYTFDLSGKDLGGHSANVTFTGGNENLFYVDKTVPMISENFYEFANESENSFNVDKTARITIVEHNFDPGLTNLRITRKAAGGEHSHNGMADVTDEILGGRKWNKSGDAYTIEFTFSEDAVYYVEIAPVDLASNRGEKHSTVIFEIDKTVPVVSAKNGETVAPDATELLDIYPYDRRDDATPTVDFTDNNIASIEYTLITYIPKYMKDGLTVVEPVVERGTIQGSRFTLEDFTWDGIYSVELVAVDVAGNRSEINYNTYARMVNQDVLAFILDSNLKEQTGLFSLEYEDGEAISKSPDDFMDLRILVMTPADTPIDIVLRDTNGKETLTTASLVSLESVYGVNVHTFTLSADFFRENFQDDIDTEMHLTVRNRGDRIDLARIHIDNIAPDCDYPPELDGWAWFPGEEDRTFTITNISELLELKDCKVYDNGVEIPFEYSGEEDTITFTLSKGWHNIGFILCDAAGNANISQEMNNIHIGNFWTVFGMTVGTLTVTGLVVLVLCKRKRTVQEMQEEE